MWLLGLAWPFSKLEQFLSGRPFFDEQLLVALPNPVPSAARLICIRTSSAPVNAVREVGAPLPARRQIVPQSGGWARVEVPSYLLAAPFV